MKMNVEQLSMLDGDLILGDLHDDRRGDVYLWLLLKLQTSLEREDDLQGCILSRGKKS